MKTAIAKQKARLPVAYLLLLGCFIGLSGLHRFYCGRRKSGLLWLLTFGLCGIGNLIDAFAMRNLVNDANEGHQGF